MNKTPAPSSPRGRDRAGVASQHNAHVAEVTNDAGGQRVTKLRRESMGTAQGEGTPTLSPQAPYLIANGVKTPLMPILYIDTQSDAGSYADALAHSVNIKQEDFNG